MEGDEDGHVHEEDNVAEAAFYDIKISASRGDKAYSIAEDAPVGGIYDDADGEHIMQEEDENRRPAGVRHQGRR